MELPGQMESLQKDIEQAQDEFYTESYKNMFFKQQQKYDCAKQVTMQVSLDLLLNKMCRILPDTDKVYIDYPTMKTFASPDIFEVISEHIFRTCLQAKTTIRSLEVHLNLDGFTMSAAERFRQIILGFCDKCFQANVGFAPIMNNFIIYNTPSTINNIKPIFAPFVLEEVRRKVILLNKKESIEPLKALGVV